MQRPYGHMVAVRPIVETDSDILTDVHSESVTMFTVYP